MHIGHNYDVGHVCKGPDCQNEHCRLHPRNSNNVSADEWKSGRRIIELDVLLSAIKIS